MARVRPWAVGALVMLFGAGCRIRCEVMPDPAYVRPYAPPPSEVGSDPSVTVLDVEVGTR